jgi:hypothetical protein
LSEAIGNGNFVNEIFVILTFKVLLQEQILLLGVGLLGRLLLLQRAHQRRSLVLPADQQLIESPTIILVELDDNFKILIVVLLCVLFWNWY